MSKPKQRLAPKVHWRCPDCQIGCECTGDARKLPHRPCGDRSEHSPTLDDAIDGGMRQAYASWLRSHSAPGGHDA